MIAYTDWPLAFAMWGFAAVTILPVLLVWWLQSRINEQIARREAWAAWVRRAYGSLQVSALAVTGAFRAATITAAEFQKSWRRMRESLDNQDGDV